MASTSPVMNFDDEQPFVVRMVSNILTEWLFIVQALLLMMGVFYTSAINDWPQPLSMILSASGVIVIAIAMVLFASLAMRQRAILAQKQQADDALMDAITGNTRNTLSQDQETLPIPPLRVLIVRNAMLLVTFLPSIWLIMLAFTSVYASIPTTPVTTEPTLIDRLIAVAGISIPLIVGFVAVMVSYAVLQKVVDRLSGLHAYETTISDAPTDEQIDTPVVESAPNAFFQSMGTIVSIVLISCVPLVVINFVPVIVVALGAPEWVEAVAVIIATVVVIGIMLWYLIRRNKILAGVFRRAIVKEYGEESKEFKEFETTVAAHENSMETRILNRAYTGFIVWMVFTLIVAMIAGLSISFLTAGSDTTPEAREATYEGVMTLVMVAGIVSFLLFGSRILGNVEPSYDLSAIDPLKKAGDYEAILGIIDDAVAKMPNWETYLPAALMHLVAGKLDDAEAYAVKMMDDVATSLRAERENNASYQTSRDLRLGLGLAILGNIEMERGNYTRSQELLQQALEHKLESGEKSVVYHTLGEVALLQRQSPDIALGYFDQALAENSKNADAQSISVPLINAQRAQAMARQGVDPQIVDATINQIIETGFTEWSVATESAVYFTRAQIAIERGDLASARADLQLAIDIDSGLMGQNAQRALDQLNGNNAT